MVKLHRQHAGSSVKAAIVVLADTEIHGGLGRLVNAPTAAKEFKEASDEVRVIFDGAGTTQWPGVLSDSTHKSHQLWESVADPVAGGLADRLAGRRRATRRFPVLVGPAIAAQP